MLKEIYLKKEANTKLSHFLYLSVCVYVLSARFTSCIAFFNILNELNDYAGQREVVAEEMGHRVYGELMRYSHDLKTERKMVISIS